MELGPRNHNGDGLLGPNSIMVVYMDPLGEYFGKHEHSSDTGAMTVAINIIRTMLPLNPQHAMYGISRSAH